MELGEAHLDEENLEALAWERQVLKNKEHDPSKYDFSFEDEFYPNNEM